MSHNRGLMGVRTGAAFLAVVVYLSLLPTQVFAASATATDVYPSTEVPTGVRVSFIVAPSGFTLPSYQVVDSFPGGVTTANINQSGNFSWTPNKDHIGSHGITVTISDAEGNTATVTKTITVIAAAKLTASTPTPGAAVAIGAPVSFSITPSGFFSPTYTLSDSFPSSSLRGSNLSTAGAFSWTPLPQDAGLHTITITAQDSYGTSASVPVDITVLPPASVSLIQVTPGLSVPASTTLTFLATTTGLVAPVFTVTDTSGSPSKTIAVDTIGKVSWTPSPNEFGTHPLNVVATDSGGRSASAKLTISVTAPLPTPPPVVAAQELAPVSNEPAPVAVPTQIASKAPQAPASAVASRQKSASTAEAKTKPTPTPEPVPSTLAYPTASPAAPHVVIPTTTPIEIVAIETPSFAQFIAQSIGALFRPIFRIFGK